MTPERRSPEGPNLNRYAAPAVFLAAVTLALLVVRTSLDSESAAPPRAAARSVAEPLPTRTVRRTQPRPRAVQGGRIYTVRAGDTLEAIAVRAGRTVADLRRLNPGVRPTSLRIGQRLRVS